MLESRRELIISKYKSGMPGKKIAKEIKASTGTVYKVLRTANLIPRPGKRNSFSEETELEIIAMYESGKRMYQVGASFGCDTVTVLNILKRHGKKSRGTQGGVIMLSGEKQLAIKQDWLDGVSQKALGEKYGFSQTVISRYLAKQGIHKANKTAVGSRHGNWKGGRIIDGNGYAFIRLYEGDPLFHMTNSGGYVAEHRLVMSKSLGRPLTEKETVHHINGIRSDNLLENLQLRSSNHGKGQHHRCLDCGSCNVSAVEI